MKREMIEIGSTIRVENGPARKVAVATAEMEPDRDEKGKAHPARQEKNAKLPSGRLLAKHYKLGLLDALGKPIVEGQQFTYLDYFGFNAGEAVWYVYELEDVPLEGGMLDRMAIALTARTGSPVAAEDITAEMIAEWFQVPVGWVSADPWQVKRFMPRENHADKDAALAAAHALEA